MVLFSKSRIYWIWVPFTIAYCVLTIANTWVYYQGDYTPIFFFEKRALTKWALWRTAFYFHIAGASVCLATGVPLMFKGLLRYKRLHRVLGYVYINSVLWVAAPAGLILSPFAKGGWVSALGFLLTGIPWWLTTWLGYRAIRRSEIESHIRWMLRSFSLALSAIWFRAIQYSLFLCGLEDQPNYMISIWLSLAASISMAEICIARRSRRVSPHPNWGYRFFQLRRRV